MSTDLPLRVLWLVAARSQSRGIPHKNVASLAGHPLLAFRIAAARSLATAADVWLSTDSEDYVAHARPYGPTVPFLRPAELASDTARSVDVVAHAMEVADAEGRAYDAVCLLEPTSPFVLPATLRAAVRRLAEHASADAVVATRVVRPSTFYVQPDTEFLAALAARLDGRTVRRQDEDVEITPSGGFYLARWEAFRRSRTFYAPGTLSHKVSDLESLEIDEPIDLDWARFLVETGRVKAADFGLTEPVPA